MVQEYFFSDHLFLCCISMISSNKLFKMVQLGFLSSAKDRSPDAD